jgi:hypothetical protein
MDTKFREWQLAVERFCSDATPDYDEVARLVAGIAADSADVTLRQAATQALPSLRSASAMLAERITIEAARRRLGVVRDVLHDLTTPRFGKRDVAPKSLTPEERYRQMLGLPLGCPLAPTEIHRAYKRAAKTAHPDTGGNARAFLELSAARDALMKQR